MNYKPSWFSDCKKADTVAEEEECELQAPFVVLYFLADLIALKEQN